MSTADELRLLAAAKDVVAKHDTGILAGPHDSICVERLRDAIEKLESEVDS